VPVRALICTSWFRRPRGSSEPPQELHDYSGDYAARNGPDPPPVAAIRPRVPVALRFQDPETRDSMSVCDLAIVSTLAVDHQEEFAVSQRAKRRFLQGDSSESLLIARTTGF